MPLSVIARPAVILLAVGCLVLAVSAFSAPAMGQGIALRGVSAVNNGMAGAATGCPIDAAGAIHWNPASISGLPASEMTFGMALILPSTELSSSAAAGSFGAAGPPFAVSGADRSEAGVVPVPNMAFVHKDADSCWTWGLGLIGIGGSSVNYSSSPMLTPSSNVILTPQPPNGYGLGRLCANVEVFQIVPTVAYELSEHLSIGFAPTVSMAKLYASPLFLGPRDNSNHDLYSTWSPGVGTRYTWGGGFQVGMYYTTDNDWHYGLSVKSPQWMEPFRYKSENELGGPRDISFNLNYPTIVSLGASYSGFENWVLACDVRYFDYANTTGFRHVGFGPDFALNGLSWNSVTSVAFGAQRRMSERFYLRGGYCFNENPIDSAAAQYNVASPLIIQHTLHMGASYMFAQNWMATLAYVHGFENSVSGPLHGPTGGNLAGTSVTSKVAADEISLGITKRF
jgi:long-chain fatty acid transport protein